MTLGWSAVLLLAASGAACGHSTPFDPTPGESGVFAPQPERMTFNARADVLHGFSASGDELFYTYCEDIKAEAHPPCGIPSLNPDPAFDNQDRCLGALPSAGGARVLEVCGTAHRDADSVKHFVSGARLADGSVAFIYWSRPPTASFALNPALWLLRPGALAPVMLLAYPASIDNLRTPARLLAAGGQSVVTLGGDGPEHLVVHENNTVTRTALPPLVAVDPSGEAGLSLSDEVLRRVSLPDGSSAPFAPLPREGDWADAEEHGIGFGGGRAVIAQSRTYLVGGTAFLQSRLVMVESTGEPAEILRRDAATFTSVAVSPDGRLAAVGLGGDIYRYPLP